MRLSEDAQKAFEELLSWELLGRDDVDVKTNLRSIPFDQLSMVAASVQDQGRSPEHQFISERLVLLEMMYRTGKLSGDWSFKRNGSCVEIGFCPRSPIQFISLSFVVDHVEEET